MDTKYSEEVYKHLKDEINKIGNNLPEHLAGWIWDNYKHITGTNEGQPCTCGSSGTLWKKAVDEIRNYIRQREING